MQKPCLIAQSGFEKMYIGFCMDMCRRALPGSQIIVQKDRYVFEQLIDNTDLCYFTTVAAENNEGQEGRAVLPIVDADAHATFFLCRRTDAQERTSAIYDAVTQASSVG